MKKEDIVLIIGESPERKNNLSAKLRAIGHSTELCSSGMHALSLLEAQEEDQKSYALIILTGHTDDLTMKDTLLLTRKIHPDRFKLPILIIYQNEQEDQKEILSAISDGANSYIVDVDNYKRIIEKIHLLAPIQQNK